MSRSSESLLLIGWLLLLCSCSRDPAAAKRAYMDSAQRHFDKGEYSNASTQFRKALQMDPRYAEAQYRLGLTEIKLRLWPDALLSLSQAAELDPKNLQARLKLAELHLATRQWEDARQRVSQVLALDSQNVDAYVLSGQVEFLDHHYQEALKALQRAEGLAPKDARAQHELADVYVVLQQYREAERHYKRAIELDPSSLPSYLNLAQLYRLENQPQAVVQVLRRAISTSPKVATPYMVLARFYLSQGNSSGLDSVFTDLRAATANSSESLLTIGDFSLRAGDYSRAKSVAEELLAHDPKNNSARKQLVKAELSLQQWNAAEKENRELLTEQPRDPETRLAQGQLLLAFGDEKDAITKLQDLVHDVPDMAAAHFALATAHSRTGNPERAVASLKDAISRDADFIPGYLALADYYQQRQDGQTALVYANEVLKRNPGLVVGRIAHANAQLMLGRLQEALAEFTTLANTQPKNPALQERLGYVELRQKNFSQAEQRFEEALEEQANFLPAMRDLVELYGTQKRLDKAVTRVQQQIEKAPEQADLYELLGDAYLSTNDWQAAERAYRAAIDHNKNAYVAHTQLAGIYAQKQKLPEAISEAQVAVQQRPDILPNYVLLGTLYEKSGAIERARASYEQALQRDPNFALALNNLAWLHCQHGGNLDVALGLAQRAKQNLPNNPDISDTLAWIEYRKGLYSSAAELLRDALRQAPDSSLFQYHLGMVLLKQGNDVEAKPILSRALASKLSAADAEQARTALRQLEAHRM